MLLKNFTSRIKSVVFFLVQFWNWKVKPEKPPALTFDERATKSMMAESLSDAGVNINLCLISFLRTDIPQRKKSIKDKKFYRCIFSKEIINGFNFEECRFIECVFNGATIIETEFHDCRFEECYFYKAKFKSTYIDPRSFSFDERKWYWDMANVNAGLFQSLYRNSKDMHQDEFAMHADIIFQFYRRYQHLRGTNPKPFKFFLNLCFDYFLGYGYGIKNTLIITAGAILLFAFMINGHTTENKGYIEALYFAVVSFTTVGFGDITPLRHSLPLAITISFLLGSVGWCAVVTAIIVKRIVK